MTTWIEDLYHLKETLREGWKRIGIENPESVTDHSYAVALIAWRLARENGLDERRVLLMSLLHDFHEARLGDIPSPDKRAMGMDIVLKAERDTEAIQWADDREILDLLADLRDQQSEEARLVGAVDGFEMLLQARRYVDQGYRAAEEFIASVLDSPAAKHPSIAKLIREL